MNISSPRVTPIPSPFSQSLKRRLKVPSPPPPSSAPSGSRMGDFAQTIQRCICAGNILADILINEQSHDCSLSFSVDRDVCIYGVEMPTQCTQRPLDQQLSPSQSAQQSYSELIYAFLQDSDGCRITYTHFTARVPCSSSMEVMFNRPVYILPNKMYKIGVVLNKVGRYPLYVIRPYVSFDEFTFTFDQDCPRSGLITAVLFGCSLSDPSSRDMSLWGQMY